MKIQQIVIICLVCLTFSTCNAVTITSNFGFRDHPIDGEYKFHSGLDIAYDEGTSIGCLWDGTVVYADWWGGYGNCVIIEHGNDTYSLYGHLSQIDVTNGQTIGQGQIIGLVGSTGYSTGPHLHLGIWQNNEWVDPLTVLGE